MSKTVQTAGDFVLECRSCEINRDGFSLAFSGGIARGQWVSVFGASGSGKSTLLDLMAGLQQPTAGAVLVSGRDVTALAPRERGVAIVFQQNALFAHLSVQENLLLALHDSQLDRRGKLKRIADALSLVELPHAFLTRRPGELSGGEAARVNIARAVVSRPVLMLMDEPMAHLDPDLRERLSRDLHQWHRSEGWTTVCVTHHFDEAILGSDNIIVLDKGRVAHRGSPATLAGTDQARAAVERARGLISILSS